MTFRNSVVGGTTLVRPAIRSPNFVTGVSGWAINRDGSAEFNNVVIRGGTVISGTALYYNGPPAAGNLFVSISAVAGSDTFGNAYVKGMGLYGAAGTLTAKDTAGNQAFISGALPVNGLLAALPGMYMQPVSNTGDAASIGALNPGGGGDLGLILTSPSPNTGGTPGTDFSQIYLTGPYSGPTTAITMSASGSIYLNAVEINNDNVLLLGGQQVNVGSSGSSAVFASLASSTTDDLISARITGDNSNSRFVVNHGGQILWGPGGGSAVDTNLYRSAASTLKTDDDFIARALTLGSIDQGLGIQSFVQISSSVTGIGAGTETVLMTIPSMTFKDGRCYRLVFNGLQQSSSASDRFLYRVRKGSATTSGTIYVDQIRANTTAVANINNAVNPQYILKNQSGADITTALTITGNPASGTGIFDTPVSNRSCAYVLDVGLESQWPGIAIS